MILGKSLIDIAACVCVCACVGGGGLPHHSLPGGVGQAMM